MWWQEWVGLIFPYTLVLVRFFSTRGNDIGGFIEGWLRGLDNWKAIALQAESYILKSRFPYRDNRHWLLRHLGKKSLKLKVKTENGKKSVYFPHCRFPSLSSGRVERCPSSGQRLAVGLLSGRSAEEWWLCVFPSDCILENLVYSFSLEFRWPKTKMISHVITVYHIPFFSRTVAMLSVFKNVVSLCIPKVVTLSYIWLYVEVSVFTPVIVYCIELWITTFITSVNGNVLWYFMLISISLRLLRALPFTCTLTHRHRLTVHNSTLGCVVTAVLPVMTGLRVLSCEMPGLLVSNCAGLEPGFLVSSLDPILTVRLADASSESGILSLSQ